MAWIVRKQRGPKRQFSDQERVERQRACCRKYAKEHPEALKKWKRENPEKVKEHIRRWQKNNPEKMKQNQRKWYLANKKRISEENKKMRKLFSTSKL